MIATLVAVFGTLAGTIVAGLMQHLTSTRTAEKAAIERRREALATAIPSLLAALVRHREQHLKIVARREERADTPESRQARYEARSAVTSAMDTLHMATSERDLLATAQEAVDAAMALGDVPTSEVDAAGLRARQAHTALREAGARHVYA